MPNIRGGNERKKLKNNGQQRQEFWGTKIRKLCRERVGFHIGARTKCADLEKLIFNELLSAIPQDEHRKQLLRFELRREMKRGGKNESGY